MLSFFAAWTQWFGAGNHAGRFPKCEVLIRATMEGDWLTVVLLSSFDQSTFRQMDPG